MKPTKPYSEPLIAPDEDLREIAQKIGLQVLSVGFQYQIRGLQERLIAIKHLAADFTPQAPQVSSPKLLHVADNEPKVKEPKAKKLPMPDVGVGKGGKRINPGINVRRIYQYALEHDGMVHIKDFWRVSKIPMGSHNLIKGTSFQYLFDAVEGQEGVYRLKTNTDGVTVTTVTPVTTVLPDKRGRPLEIGKHGQIMLDWALSHGGIFSMGEFRKAHRDLPAWRLYPQNMGKLFLSMLRPVPGQDSVWQVKPEHMPNQGAKK